MVVYTWTPSAHIAKLIPGDNVIWATVDEVLDDSNPLGEDGGADHSQLPGIANIGTEFCPGAGADGCQLGWIAADIQVTGNVDFISTNCQTIFVDRVTGDEFTLPASSGHSGGRSVHIS